MRFTVLASIVFASGVASAAACGAGAPCPQSTPCCSQYGVCGVGAYCLAGCDPLGSFDLNSCMARPVCKSADYKLTSLSDFASYTDYLGDASKTNWVYEGSPAVYQDNSILLTMPVGSAGTLVSSSHYVWYGKISATMRTSAGQGVVTAFILMSDVKDEIDFEFVGSFLGDAQANWYWNGVLNYTNEVNLTVSSPTNENYHTYTFDWQEDSMSWAIDGTTLRTVHKADTYNATTKTYQYPQTPAKIQFSLWPAGNPTSPEGTRNWAGGLISWSSPYMTNGYYWAQVSDVSVQCYDAPQGANVSGSNAYIYTSRTGLEGSVALTGANTTLASFHATGDDPGANPYAVASVSSSSSSSSAPGSTATDTPTVPGIYGAGSRGGGGDDGSAGGAQATVTTFVQGLVTKASSAAADGGLGRGGAVRGCAAAVAAAVFVLAVLV